MIKLNQRPPEPSYLRGKTVSKIKQWVRERMEEGLEVKSDEFKPYWRNKRVREPLWKLHNGKCCYCERKRSIKRESDIDHYRPKSGKTGEGGHPGYGWLAYEWTNYLFLCKICNEDHKSNHFPLLPGSVRAVGPDDNLSSELPVLLNPIDDDPEACISYNWWTGGEIFVKALGMDNDNRGSMTINILGLNDGLLMEERAENLSVLKIVADEMAHAKKIDNDRIIAECAMAIREQTSAESTFAGFKRAFFRARGLGEYVAND